MKTIKGDIVKLALAGHFDIIVHGCNCFHTMNSGVAKAIRKEFPEVYETDVQLTKKGDRGKLGSINATPIVRGNVSFYVVNAYTQFDYGYDGKQRVVYEALRTAFGHVATMSRGTWMKRIAYPKIGCGLAGGDWEFVSTLIDQALFGLDHALVEYEAVSDTPSANLAPGIFSS
jgi:O-acetyl-ADP-ribose deacetylase (regulator of RNase III)